MKSLWQPKAKGEGSKTREVNVSIVWFHFRKRSDFKNVEITEAAPAKHKAADKFLDTIKKNWGHWGARTAPWTSF